MAVLDHTAACALGVGRGALLSALQSGISGLRDEAFETASLQTWLGQVSGVDDVVLPLTLADFDCRNNRLAWLGLHADGFADHVGEVASHVGRHRVGVFLGTSTSGILQTELAYRRRDPLTGALPDDFKYASTHNTYSVAAFVRQVLGLQGPAFVVSTACSSGAKVFASAARMIDLGLIDAAVVGGVDSLCLTTLYGFNSLELLSPQVCRPWDVARNGLSIGEAAAFALLARDGLGPACAALLGVGESSDGYHMSRPHPEGTGAARAMREALIDAGLVADQIDYLNLHGTASPSNDAAEDVAVSQVFGPTLPCSSTKGATGHTLGAAGALEASLALLCLEHQFIPGGLNVRQLDPQLHCAYQCISREARLKRVASNSFGFGGSNACLIFGKDSDDQP